MGPTGDQAESKMASSGSHDLPVSISPVACRAWPSAIATQKAHFALLAIFGACDVVKVEGDDPDTPGNPREDRVRLGRRRSQIVGASPLVRSR